MKWNMNKASLKKSTWVIFSCSSLFSDCCWFQGFPAEWLTAQRWKPETGNPGSVHKNLMSTSFLSGRRSPLHTWRRLEARQGAPGQERLPILYLITHRQPSCKNPHWGVKPKLSHSAGPSRFLFTESDTPCSSLAFSCSLFLPSQKFPW